MAMFEFRLPDIGEGITEGEVVAWHVAPGEDVAEDQEMVEVMTDKATVTIGSPRSGRIARLNAAVGQRVKVGAILVVIDTSERAARPSEPREIKPRGHEGDIARSRFQTPASRSQPRRSSRPPRPVSELRPSAPPSPGEPRESAASAVGDIRESLPGASFFAGRRSTGNGQTTRDHSAAADAPFFAAKPLATPATRRLARSRGIDLRTVRPTGPGGRVTRDDVERCAARPAPAGPSGRTRTEERKPFVGLRRRIAERMHLAKSKAAHFTFVEEVEVDRLSATVERLGKLAEARGVQLHYLPFVVKAVTLALKKHPILNTTLDEQRGELVYRQFYDIGIATATEQGLLVPVVRDADQKSLLAIAEEIQRLAEGARRGTLKSHELTGSTFTVTSLGKRGGLLATPVLNYPEVGVLGVHRVKERPLVRGGSIVVGQVMNLSLSFDHRIIDGHVGAAFAYDVIAYLEDPELLLLELS